MQLNILKGIINTNDFTCGDLFYFFRDLNLEKKNIFRADKYYNSELKIIQIFIRDTDLVSWFLCLHELSRT